MIKKPLSYFILSAVLGLSINSTALAQTTDDDGVEVTESTESFDSESGAALNDNKIIQELIQTLEKLSVEDSETLLEALRTGGDFSYESEVERDVKDEDGNTAMVNVTDADGNTTQVPQTEIVTETTTLENSNGVMGYGEMALAIGLLESQLEDGATENDLLELLAGGESSILSMRAAGMGWGEIYQSFDLKVGDIMRNENANKGQTEKIERAEKSRKPEKAERAERPEKAERPERPERPEKPERPERPEKPEKPERAGRG